MIANAVCPVSFYIVTSIVIGGGYRLSPQGHVEDRDLRCQEVLWRQA